MLNYAGITDHYASTRRSIAVEGYARMQGYASNWRCFNDVYVDTTLSPVVLADKPVLSQATIVEDQSGRGKANQALWMAAHTAPRRHRKAADSAAVSAG